MEYRPCYNDELAEMETMPLTLSAAADSLLIILDDSEDRGCNEESEVCGLCNR
jgi:hypothetical protein